MEMEKTYQLVFADSSSMAQNLVVADILSYMPDELAITMVLIDKEMSRRMDINQDKREVEKNKDF